MKPHPPYTYYSEELAREIIDRAAAGEPVSRICRDEHMPSPSTVWRWCTENQTFAGRLARARESGADMLPDEVVEIADSEPDAQRARNRIEARKWAAGVINPRRYGPRLDMHVERIKVDVPLRAALERAALRPMSDPVGQDDTQVIEYQTETMPGPTDYQSDSAGAGDDADELARLLE